MYALSRLHFLAVVVTEEVEEAVSERPLPVVAHHLRAENDVPERPRNAFRHLVGYDHGDEMEAREALHA